MAIANIKITSDRPHGRYKKIYLEGQDVSKYVRRATIVIDANDVNRVVLELAAIVDMPDELMAHISAETDEVIDVDYA